MAAGQGDNLKSELDSLEKYGMVKLENVQVEDLDQSDSSYEYEQIYGGDQDDLNLWNDELREMKQEKGSFMGTDELQVAWVNEKLRKLDHIIRGPAQIREVFKSDKILTQKEFRAE